jgi:hypothetical protein
MPRLPVDGNKVIEHRITLGTYERQQLDRFIDGMQIRNIGQGIGAATDPIEALFSTTVGTVGGAFAIAYLLERVFNIDVGIPTDTDDILEIWNSILDALNPTKEIRQNIQEKIEAIREDTAETINESPIQQVTIRNLKKRLADILFGEVDSVKYEPDLYVSPINYSEQPDMDQGLQQTPEDYRAAVAARYVDGTYQFSYARYLLIQNGMSSAAASTYLDEAMGN